MTTRVARGRITNARTLNFIDFMLNPDTIREKKGSNFSEDAIPGMSDPKQGWNSGKVSLISFQLKLDGDISLRQRGVNLLNGAEASVPLSEATTTLSVAAEIAFFESFQFPVDPGLPFASGAGFAGGRRTGGPDKVVFTFGQRYPGVLCWLDVEDIELQVFTPELAPTVATLSLTLRRISDKTRYANSIWAPPQGLEGFET